MKTDGWVKTGGSRSPFSLGMLPFRQLVWPLPAGAQSADAYPHSRWSRAHSCCGPRTGPEVYGKVVIELANGPVWAFLPASPTGAYPIDSTGTTPPVSHPFGLGRLVFGDADSPTPTKSQSPHPGLPGVARGYMLKSCQSCFHAF